MESDDGSAFSALRCCVKGNNNDAIFQSLWRVIWPAFSCFGLNLLGRWFCDGGRVPVGGYNSWGKNVTEASI